VIDASLIEIVVAVLLVATCGYCIALNRRLKTLKEGQADLQRAIAAFDDATRRAEQNLARMESSGLGMGRDLDAVMARAHALVDELSVMVSAGDHIAGRIEGAVNNVRALGGRRSASGGGR
jgi:prophage DNA circulation protein